MRTMLQLACVLAVVAAALAAPAPATYDQRQDGEFNVRADVQNVVVVVAVPSKMTVPLLSGWMKSAKPATEVQERAGLRVMEAFVEPSEPYHVEIGEADRAADGDGRSVEVVIVGRRRLDSDSQPEAEVESGDELKLIGATEQCGPDRERDPVTLACRARTAAPSHTDPVSVQVQHQPLPQAEQEPPVNEPAPQVVPATT